MRELLPIAVLLAPLLAGCAGDASVGDRAPTPAEKPAPKAPRAAERLSVRVIAEYPHDPASFTQGLLVHDGALYESTGRYGVSKLRRLDPVTGEVTAERDLPARLFGEGLALAGDRLVQITWQEGVALLWNAASFEPLGELSYRGEGWGLTFDGERLVMSDGGPALVFRDPATFEETGRVDVTFEGEPVERLNELEWVDGAVWANIWGSETIVRIDPASGAVTGSADLSPLLGRLPPEESEGIDVLNGIAWWPEHGTFLVTGKLWPRLFEVVFE
jgi:glutaminyl-peptide cyclotransferase